MLGSDEVSHQEFLDIHINNSEKYLKEVEEGSAKLALENEELITVNIFNPVFRFLCLIYKLTEE